MNALVFIVIAASTVSVNASDFELFTPTPFRLEQSTPALSSFVSSSLLQVTNLRGFKFRDVGPKDEVLPSLWVLELPDLNVVTSVTLSLYEQQPVPVRIDYGQPIPGDERRPSSSSFDAPGPGYREQAARPIDK